MTIQNSGRMGRPRTRPGDFGKVSTAKKLKNDLYQVSATLRLPDGTTRRVSGSGENSSVAINALKDRAALVLASWDAVEYSLDMPMRKLAENWLVQMREDDDRAIQTIQRYEATLKNSILPKIGELTIRELTNGRLRLLIKSLARSGRVSDARIARTVIRRVLAHGVENSVGSADTFNFDGLTLSVPHKVSRAITTGELRELWQLIDTDRAKVRPGPRSTKAHDDLEDALLIVFATSLRISEVLAITADRVDFKTGVLKIEAKIEYKLGAGYREGPVKTKSTARDIPLPTYALEILEQRLAYGGMAFATSRGKPLSQNNLRRTLRACLEEHELGTWFSFHQARKAVASVVFDALGAEVAALVLGHGDGGNLIRSTYGARNPVAPNVTHLTERFARRNVGS